MRSGGIGRGRARVRPGRGRLRGRSEAILERCRDRVVLDVGCVGQDAGPASPAWLHGKIRAVSRSAHGVDTAADAVADLRRAGYMIFAPDCLPAHAEGYEVVVMADVLEHVSEPVTLLRWAAGHLRPDGCLVVTTPNPFAVRQLLLILRRNAVSVNTEHTCWFDPCTLGEVARRAELTISELEWLDDGAFSGPGATARQRLARAIGLGAARLRPYLSPSFLAVLRPGP